MGQGLRVWDQYGNITLDTDDRTSRILGTIYVNWIDDRTIQVPEFSQGTPWFFAMTDWSNIFYDNRTDDNVQNKLKVTTSGNSINLTWRKPRYDGRGYYYACWVVYGFY